MIPDSSKCWLYAYGTNRFATYLLSFAFALILSASQSISPLDFEPVYEWLKHSKCLNLKKAIDSADEQITPDKMRK